MLFNNWYGYCSALRNRKIQSKERAMSENMRYMGLCSTCKNVSSCTFPRDPDKQLINCEEFEIETTSLIMSPGKEQQVATGPEAIDKDSTKFIGLCSDCEGRQTCTFPKNEGGVWRCEEYR